MKKRKTVLIVADVLLLAACIFQGIRAAQDGAKVFELKAAPDELAIASPAGAVQLTKDGDGWVIGEKRYAAVTSSVESLISVASSVRTLDKVGRLTDETAGRYELDEGKRLSVVLKNGGKVLRTLEIGKDSAAASQGYITIDGGKDIYLASGSLRQTFSRTAESLRDNTVYSVERNDLSGIRLSPADGSTWSLFRTGTGEDTSWSISGADVTVDSTKATDWLTSFATLISVGWHEEHEDLGGIPLVSAEISGGEKKITVELFELPAQSEDDSDVYYARCSETPYAFEVASYAAQRFLKNPQELEK